MLSSGQHNREKSEWAGRWVLMLHAKGLCSFTSTYLRSEKLNIEKIFKHLKAQNIGGGGGVEQGMALLVAQTTFDEQVLQPPKDQCKVNLENLEL